MKSLNKDLLESSNLLIVIAHPDDVSHAFGGLVQVGKNHRLTITLLCLTSDNKANSSEMDELTKSANLLGIDLVISENFSKNNLAKDVKAITKCIEDTIKSVKADTVFTFDYSGITGHVDHLTLSSTLVKIYSGKKVKSFKLYLRVPDPRERKYFSFKKAINKSLPATHVLTFGFTEGLTKLKAMYVFESKISSFLYKLHLLDWHIFDHYEFFHKVKIK